MSKKIMNVSIEEKKAEAVKRMKAIGIFPETIKQFEKQGLVSISEPPVGAFFWTDEQETADVKAFEEEYNCLVYCIIRSYTAFGKLDSYLYVSDNKEEWEWDWYDLKDNLAVAYVKNHDVPEFSEFGTIGFEKTIAAGLKRTA